VQKVKRTTIKDVALRAGTSIATVSYVLNNSKNRYITAEMRKAVEDAARELGYVKSAVASGLKGKGMGVIAFLTPQFDNHFFLDIFFAVEKIANSKGYVLSVCNTFDNPEHEKTVIERMQQLWVDAYVIIPTHNGTENTEYIRTHNIPYVAAERPLDDLDNYNFISSDNFQASYDMTTYFINRGHKRIALVYWETQITNLHERLDGYKQALADNNLPFDENLVKITSGITHEDGIRVTKEIIKDTSITGIFYSQYILAEGGIKFLHQSKIAIPDKISVGVLGGPKWAEMSELSFAHMLQPGTAVGNKAAEIIFAELEGAMNGNIQEKLPSELHTGNSIRDIN